MTRNTTLITLLTFLVVILGGYYAYTELYSQPTNDTPTETENVNEKETENTTGTSTSESGNTNEGTNAQEDTEDEERPEDGAEYVFRGSVVEKVGEMETETGTEEQYRIKVEEDERGNLPQGETLIVNSGDCLIDVGGPYLYLFRATYNSQDQWYECSLGRKYPVGGDQ